MNIASLLAPQDHAAQPSSSPSTTSSSSSSSPSQARPTASSRSNIRDDELMGQWKRCVHDAGFRLLPAAEQSKLTDALLDPVHGGDRRYVVRTPLHIKIIGRHMNGSFRCHIGVGKASRPLWSWELYHDMRLLAVFFRAGGKSAFVSPEFILFPTWLLHTFRYTRHATVPGRTDVRFLEREAMAKEDHIYRLNHVINTLFRFSLHDFDKRKLRDAVEMANFLFDLPDGGPHHHHPPQQQSRATSPPRPPPPLYTTLLSLLSSPRPPKTKPLCRNCSTKPASRRKLCVACYRYLLKHSKPRPLRLIVAGRHHHQRGKTQGTATITCAGAADNDDAATGSSRSSSQPEPAARAASGVGITKQQQPRWDPGALRRPETSTNEGRLHYHHRYHPRSPPPLSLNDIGSHRRHSRDSLARFCSSSSSNNILHGDASPPPPLTSSSSSTSSSASSSAWSSPVTPSPPPRHPIQLVPFCRSPSSCCPEVVSLAPSLPAAPPVPIMKPSTCASAAARYPR